MRDTFKEALMASRSDLANRYSSGLRLSQTSFASTALVHLVNTEKLTLENIKNLSEGLASKLAELRPDVGLTHLLTMPFQMQKELFDLKDEEVIELRRAITGMGHKVTDPKRKWLSAKDHELLFKQRPAKD
jgi:hypothetical protein